MHENLATLGEDADVHRPGMQVDAAVKWVLGGVESHEVSSSLKSDFPNTSIPKWYAEEEASISIIGLEPTASGVRYAPASDSGSGPAFGHHTIHCNLNGELTK